MKRFPKELQHEAGIMTLDETRLQLVLKKSSKIEYVKENLADTGFILEGISEEGEGFKFDSPIINHTDKRFWIRLQTDKIIDDSDLNLLEQKLKPLLDHIAPVFRLANTEGYGGLGCPLPNVLLIKPARVEDQQLLTRIEEFGAEEDVEKSKYLCDYRYFVLRDVSKVNAYQLGNILKEEGLASEVLFENMPFVIPLERGANDPFFVAQGTFR